MSNIRWLVPALAPMLLLGCDAADPPTGPAQLRAGFTIAGFDLASLDAGAFYACGLRKNGQAYCWGTNASGQLGDGNAPNDSDVPVKVSSGTIAFASVTAGDLQACALTAAGQAYCWGANAAGQLGDDNAPTASDVPVAVAGGSLTFASVSAGSQHTCGLTAGGQAYCWGSNAAGQLGDDNGGTDSDVPVAVAPPVGSTTPLTFSSVSAGTFHTCGVTSGLQAYCWGSNQFGQLGDDNAPITTDVPVAVAPPLGGTTPLPFVSVTGGDSHTCGVVKVSGQVYCWGSNSTGQLGDDNQGVDSDVPVPLAPPAGGTTPLTFASVSAGAFHTCGVTRTKGGQVACWGGNAFGTLGNGTEVPAFVPVAVSSGSITFVSVSGGGHHTCGLAKGRGAWCWGQNAFGQLGNDQAPVHNFAPSPVASP